MNHPEWVKPIREKVARALYRSVYGYSMPVDSETPFNERFLAHADAAIAAILGEKP
jgi:hypothetical protein